MQLSHDSLIYSSNLEVEDTISIKIPEAQAVEETIDMDGNIPDGIAFKSLKPDAVFQFL